MKATLHTDGGARGNPGPAGIGYVLKVSGQEPITHSEYIGQATNNVAEYTALIRGLRRASQENISEIECILDSELVVRQMQGRYRVRDVHLQKLFTIAREAASRFRKVTYTSVRREQNKLADALVNAALDSR